MVPLPAAMILPRRVRQEHMPRSFNLVLLLSLDPSINQILLATTSSVLLSHQPSTGSGIFLS
jgi:hypothetical protein